MISKIYHHLTNSVEAIFENRRSLEVAASDKEILDQYRSPISSLSAQEKREINEKWGAIVKDVERGYPYYEGIKALVGFNSDYIPSCYYYPRLLQYLNPDRESVMLGHKSVIQLLFSQHVKLPRTILRSYAGNLFDENLKLISRREAADILLGHEGDLFIKQATNSNQGQGVKKLNTEEKKDLAAKIFALGAKCHPESFVIQEPVLQSASTARFNPSSLNTFRICTLNLNNNVSVTSVVFKCGPVGAVVDNIGSGRNGVIIGINPSDCTMKEFGFYGNGERVYSHNGIDFKNKVFPQLPKLMETAALLHKNIHSCKFIGWDIALDQNDEPVMIEGNTVYPGIMKEQMCTGPIFAERTAEVIEFIRKQQNHSK